MILNDRDLLIVGISTRLRECYAAELICLVLRHYEGSHWYGQRRHGMHKDLDMLLKGTADAIKI